ncbi:MAG TPA: APC family permease [Rhizomicrobium sp.]|nr:APC family permease [Rhizomicrobium sp.]
MTAFASRGHLLRLLGATFGVAVGVGEMIGSGILRSPSAIAASLHESGIIIALWSFGALHALLGANVLAELGTALPQAGGPYVYARRAFGDLAGLVVGWTTFASHLAGIAAASVVFADFLALLWPPAAAHTGLFAVSVQLLLYALNAAGLREGRAIQEATSFAKGLLLAAFIAAAIWVGVRHGIAPRPAMVHVAPIGFFAYISAYQLIAGAYAGWAAPTVFTEENVEPSRSLPRALFYGLLITAALYIFVNASLLYALGTEGTAASNLPFATVLARVGGASVSIVFVIGAMVTVTSCANANIMVAPRILFAMSRDRLLPASLQEVNDGGSPFFGFVLTAAISLALAATGAFRTVFGLIGTLNALSGVITDVAFFGVRRREPGLARPFRALLSPWLPALLVLIDGALFVLFAASDLKGAIVAAALCALCIPFALFAHRTRFRAAA